MARSLGGGLEASDERADDRVLVGRSEICAPRIDVRFAELADGVEQRRLEARERVEPGTRATETERLGVALARAGRSRRRPDSRARAGAHPCRTPRPRVVERRAEDLERCPVADREQERVAPAREQARERRLERVGRQVERRDVALEVVDGDERDTACPRDRLGGRDADEQRADEARPCVTPTRSTSSKPSPASSSAARTTGEISSDGAGGDLGHHAAEPRVKVGL